MADALGMLNTTSELKAVVDRRLINAREYLAGADQNMETLDREYCRGQIMELEIVQDLLCMVLKLPRTHAAS